MSLRTMLVAGLAVAWAACGVVERAERATDPDRPFPTVPAPPRAPVAEVPPARAIVLLVPGLDLDAIERGVEAGDLPSFERVRREGTLRGTIPRAVADPSRAAPPGFDRLLADLAYAERRIVAIHLSASELGTPPASAPAADDATAPPLRALFRTRGGAPFDGGGTLVVEDSADTRAPEAAPPAPSGERPDGSRTLALAPTTGGAAGDVFLVPMTADGSVRVEVFAAPDRTRATATSSEDEVALRPGRWSAPLRVRRAAAEFARVRFYLLPDELARMRLFVAPVAVDPAAPAEAISLPPSFAAEQDATLLGPLPDPSADAARRIHAAHAAGQLSARDVAAWLTADFDAEARLFQGWLVRADHELFAQRFDLIDETRAVGPGANLLERREEIEFLGHRVAREDLVEAAVDEIDRLLGAALDAVASGELGADVAVLLWSGRGDAGRPGVLASNRKLPAGLDAPGLVAPEDAAPVIADALRLHRHSSP